MFVESAKMFIQQCTEEYKAVHDKISMCVFELWEEKKERERKRERNQKKYAKIFLGVSLELFLMF